MNALLVNSLAGGGAEKVVLTVLTELIKRGHHIQLICLEKNNVYELPADVNIIYLSHAKGSEHGLKKLLYLPILALKLLRIIKKHKICVVQSHLFRANYVNIIAKLIGRRHNAQVVNTGSITAKYASRGIQGKINLFLINKLYPYASLIITKSKGMMIDLDQQFCFNVPKKILYNPSLRSLIKLKQKEPFSKEEFKFQSSRRYVITMSRMHPHKSLNVLIKSFSLLAKKFMDTDLVILGDGDERLMLETLIDQLELNERVFLMGQVVNPYKYLIHSNIYVLPSSNEGFPNSLIEAMLCKLPIISTDCMSGPREILSPETDVTNRIQDRIDFAPFGILVPVNNPDLMTVAMSTLLEDSSMCKHYAEKGYERACMFSKDEIIDEYEKILFADQFC